jgi:hypothetical protein
VAEREIVVVVCRSGEIALEPLRLDVPARYFDGLGVETDGRHRISQAGRKRQGDAGSDRERDYMDEMYGLVTRTPSSRRNEGDLLRSSAPWVNVNGVSTGLLIQAATCSALRQRVLRQRNTPGSTLDPFGE